MKIIFQKGRAFGKSLSVRHASILATILIVVPRTASAGPILDGLVKATCNVANYVFTFAIIASIFMALIAAYKYMTAGGDSTKVSEAHKTILYAAIGVAVTLVAGGFPNIIAGLVGEKLPGNGCQ